MAKKKSLLGEYQPSFHSFGDYSRLLKPFKQADFANYNQRQKTERINRLLVDLINRAPDSTFLFSPVLEFIDRINREKILEQYTFSSFELWMNQFSTLSSEENYRIRAKIVGKGIPRSDYQVFFPVGMGTVYPGTHFVTAHGSPDLDTTIASFWGWIDAFGARIGEGLHVWNVPGGVPISQVEIPILFNQIFGENIFTYIAKGRGTLALSSIDLMTQKGVIRKQTGESSLSIEHQRNQKSVILIDKRGYYLGDWRNFDVEGVRQIILLLNNALRWYENHLHIKLISLFAKEELTKANFSDFIKTAFSLRIADVEPIKECSDIQKEYVEAYLTKVLGVQDGIQSTFEDFALAMEGLSIFEFQEFVHIVQSLPRSALFNTKGVLLENRPKIFHYLEKIIKGLDKAIQSVRTYVERLDVALEIKSQVFGYLPRVISYRADLEEIRNKMGTYPYLTVTYSDEKGRLLPIGVVRATDLYKPVLGTVTLRDFCNRDETKIPSYLEVISVVDHHKSALNTSAPPVALISDAQSSNTLVAQLAFQINDRYSLSGMTMKEIEAQMKEVGKNLSSPKKKRIYRRLLQRHLVAEQNDHNFFIDPQREYVEYLHFLFAILDDTDLLTKVTVRDVECVASILNRLKSLSLKKEEEVISFDQIPKDEMFVSKAAKAILQNTDMYSLYRRIYISKEEAIEKNLQLCAEGKSSSVFADTKELNGCTRVGQTKMFAHNFGIFHKHVASIRKAWVQESQSFNRERGEVDLYLHMTTTLPGAEDLYSGNVGKYNHRDEIWVWVPTKGLAIAHLKSFLNAFSSLPEMQKDAQLEVEFLGDNATILKQAFTESFVSAPYIDSSSKKKGNIPIAVIRFEAGTIKSRKAKISPFLPKLVN